MNNDIKVLMEINQDKALILAANLGKPIKIKHHLTGNFYKTGYIYGVVFSNFKWCVQYTNDGFNTVDIIYAELNT